MFEREILDLFNVVIVDGDLRNHNTDYVDRGFVLDFKPTMQQLVALNGKFKPLDVKTLFSVSEREAGDIFALLNKQILHYIEVYGLGQLGMFNLEVTSGTIVTLNYVRGVSVDEFNQLVQNLLYSNAPVKSATVLKDIINALSIPYNINQVKNNELRVMLFDIDEDIYSSGDDVVRYMCYKATGNALLIKSKPTIDMVKMDFKGDNNFFERHSVQLAKVFNRHKPLILAAKNKTNAAIINKIGRLSKTLHEPIREGINKRFVALALNNQIVDMQDVLSKITVRDKFKFLNLLEYKKAHNSIDAFIIRNGRVHIAKDRKIYGIAEILHVENEIISSLREDLLHLSDKTILLDKNVDYGLPVSRKQTLGNLPFGTKITIVDAEISSGIYWHADGGANDLDLSVIDILHGQRVGWGDVSGYNDEDIIFSGDIISAYDGAMEFLTSKNDYEMTYGLFVNIFSGLPKSKMQLIIGTKSTDQWIDAPIVREDYTLPSKGSVLGFVQSGVFTVYATALNNNISSFDEKSNAILAKGTGNFWTIYKLFNALDIKFTLDNNVRHDYNMLYNSFSYDKLETLFNL